MEEVGEDEVRRLDERVAEVAEDFGGYVGGVEEGGEVGEVGGGGDEGKGKGERVCVGSRGGEGGGVLKIERALAAMRIRRGDRKTYELLQTTLRQETIAVLVPFLALNRLVEPPTQANARSYSALLFVPLDNNLLDRVERVSRLDLEEDELVEGGRDDDGGFRNGDIRAVRVCFVRFEDGVKLESTSPLCVPGSVSLHQGERGGKKRERNALQASTPARPAPNTG